MLNFQGTFGLVLCFSPYQYLTREDIGEEKYVKLFFDLLGIEPDWEKIKYYILLDELF